MEAKENRPHGSDSHGSGVGGVEMRPPPLVSLSLRTRESCALALKHIFDQMNANFKTNPNFTTDGDNSPVSQPLEKKECLPDASGTGLQDAKGHVSEVLRQTKEDGLEATNVGHFTSSLQSNPSNFPNRQHSAQLTIFYSGTVNVYNDVPADKANAIMLLAGNDSTIMNAGNQWKKSVSSPKLPSTSPVNLHSSGKQNLPSPTVSNTDTNITSNNNSSLIRPSLQPASAQGQSPVVPKRSSGIELPHARKASLARFLEKRKDRVQKPTASMANDSVPVKVDMYEENKRLPKRQALGLTERG